MRRHVLRIAVIASAGAILAFAPTSSADGKELCDSQAKRALVLSGGGFRGAFEAGAIYHLVVHRGCDFQDFAGVSAGALNAAYLGQAPSQPASLDRLKEQAKGLVEVWRHITKSRQIYKPRFFGLKSGFLGIFVLDRESVYLLDPLRALIRDNISLDRLKTSGRAVRVGVVSFWDETYREIPVLEGRLTDAQFRDYVLASTAMPVISEMPRIREEPEQSDDNDLWAQFADGGVRRTTPVVNYFWCDEQELGRRAKDRGIIVFDKHLVFRCKDESGHIPAHQVVQEVFVLVTFPYVPGRLALRKEPNRHIKSGKQILDKSHRLAVIEPTLWDVRFGHLANKMLHWRESAYSLAAQMLTPADFRRFTEELNRTFPIESFNRPSGSDRSLPYDMHVISPEKPLEDPLDVGNLSPIIAEQLQQGCKAANREFNEISDLKEQCDTDFPIRGR